MILSRAAVEAPSSASHYFVLGLRERVRGPLAASPMALDVCYPVIAKTNGHGESRRKRLRSSKMRTKNSLYLSVAAIAIVAFLAGAPTRVDAQQGAPVTIGDSDLGGVVRGPNGPEAGVWVIAETADLPTKMAKIVVTDDQGRYVLPGLPKANYTVWVRGYGLIDSPRVQAVP